MMSPPAMPANSRRQEPAMDKKDKKRMTVLRERIQNRRNQLNAARQQPDEPGEVEALEAEIAKLDKELQQLKSQ
jgi:hypothetical protein